MEDMDPDVMFTSDTEKTFQYDESLPSLPVPSLQHTLDRYLDSAKPHLTDAEYRQTQFIVQQFASGVGKELHQELVKKAASSRNWLAKWWLDYAYMDFRSPVGPLLNFAGPGPYKHNVLPSKEGSQIERAGYLMHFNLKYWQMIRKYEFLVSCTTPALLVRGCTQPHTPYLSLPASMQHHPSPSQTYLFHHLWHPIEAATQFITQKLSQWWQDYAYMDFRLPIAPLVNFAGPGPYLYHFLPPQEGTQVERTALITYISAKYWNMIRKERLRPDKDSKGQRFSMSQYRNAYSTCRIPAVKRDHMKFYFKTESEGPSPLNMTVFCRGRIFSMKAVDENEEPLTPPELQKQFQYIRDKCDSLPMGPGVGALTGDNRESWAEMRSRLLSIHPKNHHILEEIQKSVMGVVLDDSSPKDETELFHLALAGDSTNRWFDKSISLIFFKNGLVASNCDHSPMDAMVLVTSTYYVDLCVKKCQGKWQGSTDIRELETPQELQFVLDDVLYRGIDNAKQVYNTYAKNLQCCSLEFTDYGKGYLRKCKLHPDTHVQLALQYAYYKTYKRPAATYETGTTRKFYNARTETVRSCTVEGIDWSKAMLDPDTTMETKFHKYRHAVDKQNFLMNEATQCHGCDRHLFGLQILAIESGLPMPQLYTDPAYVKSGGGGNFILSTSFVGYTSVFGGVVPMCENGYGTFYKIEQNSISIFATSWLSSPETDAVKFNHTIHDCLREMKIVIDTVTAKSARL